MVLRDQLQSALRDAMKTKDALRLSTLRLINAALKDREIALRGQEETTCLNTEEIITILARMVKQRQESARSYEEGGRLELAEKERAEILVIEEFLPRQMSDEEVNTAITDAISQSEARSIRDMGKVMAYLKSHYAGQMDFGTVGPMVKARLA